MKIYYIDTGVGCTLIEARNEQAARREALADVGALAGIKAIREATSADVDWVRGMGGYVPKDTRGIKVK